MSAPFTDFLFALRGQGLKIGTGEWLTFVGAVGQGVIATPNELHAIGRAILCRSEADFDAYDLAFAHTFRGAALPPDLSEQLLEWLNQEAARPEGEPVAHDMNREQLWKELLERLKKQKEEHNGGNYWVGTRGTSPFGHSGNGADGIRIGGPGGGRQAVEVAMEREWENYRTDCVLDRRDLQIALRALRNLSREGRPKLDLDASIRATCDNAGEIELVERPDRQNQVRLVLVMDAGGSMAPHAERVEELFRAAEQVQVFKSFESYMFHNCPYAWLYEDYAERERVSTARLIDKLSPRHRLLFVGDASMAPYELFSSYGWPIEGAAVPGIEWLRRFKARCSASVWLNPDPQRYWAHPTVDAIGKIFPMFELTIDGLRQAVRKLRAPV